MHPSIAPMARTERFSGVSGMEGRDLGKCQTFPQDARLSINPLFVCSEFTDRIDASKALLSANLSRIESKQTGLCFTRKSHSAKALLMNTSDSPKQHVATNHLHSQQDALPTKAFASSPAVDLDRISPASRNKIAPVQPQPKAETAAAAAAAGMPSLQQQLKRARSELLGVKDQLETELRHKHAMQQLLDERSGTITTLKLRLRTALAEKKAAQEQAESSNTEMALLRQQLADCQKQLVTVQAEKTILEQEFDIAVAEKTAAQDQEEEQNHQIDTLKEQLSDCQAQLESSQSTQELLKQDYRVAMMDIERYEEQEVQHALLKEDLDIAMQDVESHAKQYLDLQNYNQQLEEQLRQYHGIFTAVQNGDTDGGDTQDVVVLRASVRQLQQQLEQSANKHNLAMEALTTAHDQKLAALHDKYAQQRQQNLELALDRSAASVVCEDQRRANYKTSKELDEQKRLVEQLQEKVQNLQQSRHEQACHGMFASSPTSKPVPEVSMLQEKLEDAIADSNRWQEKYAQQSEDLGDIKRRFKSRLAHMSSASRPATTPVRCQQALVKEDDELLSRSPASVLDWW